MIRVAIAIEQTGSSWLGGLNYFRNLLATVKAQSDSGIEMVIVTGQHVDLHELEQYAPVIRTSLLDINGFWRSIRKVIQKSFNRDLLLYILLRKHHINFLSHSDYLWKGKAIPAMPWIPDFQHLHLPNLFSQQERIKRDQAYLAYVKYGDCVLLSSYAAQKDLQAFAGNVEHRSKVLQFAACLAIDIRWPLKDELKKKYNLDRPWFHMPNQFWEHKNHLLVIEALRIAKQKGETLIVVATGNKHDERNSKYYSSIMKKIEDYGLKNDFLCPGIVPYGEMLGLMRYSMAVINPSRFEGWSTIVEEARAIGKATLLSDIKVHQEQSPPRSRFFNVDDADELAGLMIQVKQVYSCTAEERYFNDAAAGLQSRQAEFFNRYKNIVLEIMNGDS